MAERERVDAFARECADIQAGDDLFHGRAPFGREIAVHVKRIVEAARDHAAAVDRKFEAHVFFLLFGRNEADVRSGAHRAARCAVEAVRALAAVGIDPLIAANHAQERALARSVGAGKRPMFARLERPGGVFERVMAREMHVDVLQIDERQRGGEHYGKYPAIRVAARRTSVASACVTGTVARTSGAARLSAP